MKRTGINIEVVNPTGDPAEKLALMLAGKDYPDIVLMDRGSDIVNKYIEAGGTGKSDGLSGSDAQCDGNVRRYTEENEMD